MKSILAILFLLFSLGAYAQSHDSVTPKTSNSLQKKDSVVNKIKEVHKTPLVRNTKSDSTLKNTDSTEKMVVALPPTKKELLEKALDKDAIQHTYAGKNIVSFFSPIGYWKIKSKIHPISDYTYPQNTMTCFFISF
jgi:hypothetical protein